MTTLRAILLCATCSMMIGFGAKGNAEGADVILGELIGPRVYARQGGVAALSVGTTSCNAGNRVLQWKHTR